MVDAQLTFRNLTIDGVLESTVDSGGRAGPNQNETLLLHFVLLSLDLSPRV
jgi:hypothetical protein